VKTPNPRIPVRLILVRALHPPVRDRAFWAVQSMVVFWAVIHVYVDLHNSLEGSALPYGVPIDLLLIPVGYAALRYGLSGSAATTVWAILLWMPDLLIPDGKGHYNQDIVQLVIVFVVALFVGLEIERAHLERARAETAEAERHMAERHYHSLFDVNPSPIVLIDPTGNVQEANPAALRLWRNAMDRSISELLGVPNRDLVEGRMTQLTVRAPEGDEERNFRLSVSNLEPSASGPIRQIVLEDVTEEYRSEREARRWAMEVLQAQEDERRRIAREIHDDPLQRLLQLARRLEVLELPDDSTDGDEQFVTVREELLGVVGHLREVTRGLHPAGLDQHGLVAAVRGLIVDLEVDEDLATGFIVVGEVVCGSPEAEVGLFRIIQEAVRNVIRHAKATSLVVSIHYAADSVNVTIVDDGDGFDLDRDGLISGNHLGILSMRERATLLDGHCAVHSANGEGTTVDATVPLHRVAVDLFGRGD
jgi:signal transduction histidine kinase